MTRFAAADEQYMRLALRLALRGRGRVEPNPMVGCVMVKQQRIIASGWHRRYGGPHAEVEALRVAGTAARGATAYVTLEPCNHHGKTPPCTDALLAAGVKRVCAAMRDPNPLVAGRGLAALRRRGVAVDVGVLQEQAAALNAPFLKWITHKRPWLIAKWAQSLDGRIATRTGDARWISDEAARRHAHSVRGRMDAVLVGVGTVLSDDPLLTCRAVRPRRTCARVVVDSALRTPPDAKLVQTAGAAPTLLAHDARAAARRRRALAQAGCVLLELPRHGTGLSLTALLDELGRRGMTNVLCEGGPTLLGSLFDQLLVDEVHAYLAPILIGGRAAPAAIGGEGCDTLAHATRLPDARLRALGGGWLLQTRLRREPA